VDDMIGMGCERWQDAISALADGEDPGIDERLIDAHTARCAECRLFATAIDGSRRRLAVQPAAEMPDLSRRVAKTNALLDRAGKWSMVRALLIVVAVEIVIAAAPGLVLGDGEANAHDARHLGAFSIAYAVALLVAAVRPARARTVLPVAAVLAGALVVTAVVDLANGTVPLLNEASHLPELISVVLVWLLALPARDRPVHERGSARHALRIVQDRPQRDAM
jgi:predicted anti-sigma-YlaC factor YlaD